MATKEAWVATKEAWELFSKFREENKSKEANRDSYAFLAFLAGRESMEKEYQDTLLLNEELVKRFREIGFLESAEGENNIKGYAFTDKFRQAIGESK